MRRLEILKKKHLQNDLKIPDQGIVRLEIESKRRIDPREQSSPYGAVLQKYIPP
jgi:hypothetical protein